jgi:hypothetical protein
MPGSFPVPDYTSPTSPPTSASPGTILDGGRFMTGRITVLDLTAVR